MTTPLPNPIYTTEYRHVIERIKKARRVSGLNQAQVATKLGKTQSYVSKLESGLCRVDIIELKRLATIFNKPISYFVK